MRENEGPNDDGSSFILLFAQTNKKAAVWRTFRIPKFFVFDKGNFEASFDDVNKRLNSLDEKVYLYKGLFTETANQLKNNLLNRKVSIVNIDCDIYSSTVDSLNIISDYLQVGSIILLDDYNSFNADNNKGQRKAISEFKSNSNWVLEPFFSYMFSGQSFLICGKK